MVWSVVVTAVVEGFDIVDAVANAPVVGIKVMLPTWAPRVERMPGAVAAASG